MKSFAALPLAAALLTAGCAATGPFPSLAVREAERLYASGDPLQSAPEAPDRAGLAGRIAGFLSAASQGDAAFERALAAARPLAARAGASGSESWVAAQEALSRLEAARATTSKAVGALDEFGAAEAKQGPLSKGDYDRLTAALARGAALAAKQQQAVDALRRGL